MSNETVLTGETIIINNVIVHISTLEAIGFKREIKKGGRFKPKDGDRYYTLLADGSPRLNIWEGSNTDNNHYALGNCYRTVAEVTAARNKQLALVRVQDKLEELTGEPLDWSNPSRPEKVVIAYLHNERRFTMITGYEFVQLLPSLYGSKKGV